MGLMDVLNSVMDWDGNVVPMVSVLASMRTTDIDPFVNVVMDITSILPINVEVREDEELGV